MSKPFYVYVDVDETFVRNYGTKRIPIPAVLEHIKELKEQGAVLCCWRRANKVRFSDDEMMFE